MLDICHSYCQFITNLLVKRSIFRPKLNKKKSTNWWITDYSSLNLWRYGHWIGNKYLVVRC